MSGMIMIIHAKLSIPNPRLSLNPLLMIYMKKGKRIVIYYSLQSCTLYAFTITNILL